MHGDILRWIVFADMAALIVCGTYLHSAFRRDLPSPIFRFGVSLLLVVAVVALTVGVNATATVNPTPGLYVLVAVVTPVALAAVVGVVQLIRRR